MDFERMSRKVETVDYSLLEDDVIAGSVCLKSTASQFLIRVCESVD